MFFLAIVILLLFIMQILFLNKFHEIYKNNQLTRISESIKKIDNITDKSLENLAQENNICIYVYEQNNLRQISSKNKHCSSYLNSKHVDIINYMKSNLNQNQTYINETLSKNKIMIKGIKYNQDQNIFFLSSLESLDSSIVIIAKEYKFIIIILAFVGIVLAIIISNKLTQPIEELSKSAGLLANGRINVKFDSKSNIVEIDNLSNVLEKARIELSKIDELRKDLMANVGHDLKTPLTMIKAYAEMSRDLDTQSAEKKIDNMNIIIEETDRLNTLVKDILDLSKLQSNLYKLEIGKFDLNDLINNILKRYYILIEKENYKFIYNNKKSIIVVGDKKRIEQVIYNLINNAINYTGKDKIVYINVIENKETVRVEIKDTGKGIKKSEIKDIWDKYYHNNKKYKRNVYGTGLGLSIVKNILEEHNYNYGVKSKKDEGSTFFFDISKTK